MGYKKYLLTGGKIPRQTLWNRRQRDLRQQRILQAIQVSLDAGGQTTQPTIVDNNSLPSNVGDQGQSQSMSTDDENSLTNNIENVQACMSDESIQLTEESRRVGETSGMTESPTDDIPNRETDMSSPDLDTPLQSDNSGHEEISDSADMNEGDQWSPQQMEMGTSHSDVIINREQLKVPLCSHTSTTAGDVLFMTLALGVKHNISWEGQVDILNMVRSIFESSDIPSTNYQYMKLIDPPSTEITKHIYCTVCDTYLGTTLEFKNGNAACKYCQHVTDTSKELSVFLSASIEAQLQKHMTDPVFVNSLLTERFTRVKSSAESLEDIYDGVEYRKLFDDGGILSDQYNFSYSFFIDGISLGKSSERTIWPIFLTINELSFDLRPKYFILAGMYVGNKDPDMNLFLKPFINNANRLSSAGFAWIHNGNEVLSRILPLICISDSAARYKLMNFQSYAAYYGCTVCYQKSSRTRTGLKFTIPVVKANDRTESSTLNDIFIAFQRKDLPNASERHCRGVKGPSPLLDLNYFKMIVGCVIDHMHTIFLCCVKTHFELIFESSRKKIWIGIEDERLGVEHLKKTIDGRLLGITPPSFITRAPRSLSESSYWKANEWRAWLLFYCVPCLNGLLKDKYVCHIAMLSKATFLMLQKNITKANLEEAQKLFSSYLYFFEQYFGEENMTYSNHLLSHVVKGAVNWGPFWTHNGFCYESQNRTILQYCNNSGHKILNMTRKFLIYAALPVIFERFHSSPSTVKFVESKLKRRLKYFVHGEDGCLLMGKGVMCEGLSPEELFFLQLRNVQMQNCLEFNRFLYNSKRFTTVLYQGKKKHNDSCFRCTMGKYYILVKIIALPDLKVLLFVRELKVTSSLITQYRCVQPDQIKIVQERGNISCIEPHSIESPCVVMKIGRKEYVCEVPFGRMRNRNKFFYQT